MLPTIITALALSSTVIGQCTRDSLKSATNTLLNSFMTGSSSYLTSPSTIYTENAVNTSISTGIFSHPLNIAHNRSTFDTTQCATYTEIIVTDASHPYVIGTQMRFDQSNTSLAKIETIVTDAADWAFNAANTLKYASAEDGLWGEIAAGKRDTRETIQKAADAYLDVFNDKSVKVPWGIPCERLEGGMYTGKGSANDSEWCFFVFGCFVGLREFWTFKRMK
jgi:hypothetical protein